MKRKALLTAALSIAALTAVAALALLPSQNGIGAGETIGIDGGAGSAPGTAALRATINPETGGVDVSTVPSFVPLDGATAQALRRDAEGLEAVHHADGSVSVNLQGRFQNVSVARIDENGKLVICSEDDGRIDEVLRSRSEEAAKADRSLEVR